MKIVTISGSSGSGKTTLAEQISKKLPNSLLLSLDRYYLSKDQQIEMNGFCNFDFPTAIDIKLLKEHLAELKEKGSANVPQYDFTISQRVDYEIVTATNFIIIDGLFSGSLLIEESDLNIFVDADLDLALLRRIDRDMNERGRTLESVKNQYINDVRPAYFKHIESIKPKADIVITNNGDPDVLSDEADKIIKDYLNPQPR